MKVPASLSPKGCHSTPRDDLDAFLVPPPAAPAETTVTDHAAKLQYQENQKWIVSLDIGSLDSLDSLFTIKN